MVIFYIILAVAVIGGGIILSKAGMLNLTVFVGAALVALILPLPVHAATMALAKSDQETFHEYFNGFETGTSQNSTVCYKNGSCLHTYSCDPHQVPTTETYTGSDGKTHTRSTTKTVYDSCPYSTQETSFYVSTTLGEYTVASHLMTGHPYRFLTAIPGGQVTHAPAEWTAVKARVAAGKPNGVTKVSNYKNYILASESSVFKRYSGAIDSLNKKNLLPAPSAGVTGMYGANKAYFVGNLGKLDKSMLTRQMQNLDGAVGTELRGDVHVVFVNSAQVKMSHEDYGNALLAYWQSKQFGRNAIAKNTIILVVGVTPATGASAASTVVSDPTATTAPAVVSNTPAEAPQPAIKKGTPTVDWAKAFTGMPVGNEGLLNQFATDLPGTAIDKNFIGKPTFNIKTQTVVHTDGVVESMLYGENKFVRVSMSGNDKGDNGSGFKYLSNEWTPDTGTLILFYVISTLLFLGALIGGMFMSVRFTENRTYDPIKILFTSSKGTKK